MKAYVDLHLSNTMTTDKTVYQSIYILAFNMQMVDHLKEDRHVIKSISRVWSSNFKTDCFYCIFIAREIKCVLNADASALMCIFLICEWTEETEPLTEKTTLFLSKKYFLKYLCCINSFFYSGWNKAFMDNRL